MNRYGKIGILLFPGNKKRWLVKPPDNYCCFSWGRLKVIQEILLSIISKISRSREFEKSQPKLNKMNSNHPDEQDLRLFLLLAPFSSPEQGFYPHKKGLLQT